MSKISDCCITKLNATYNFLAEYSSVAKLGDTVRKFTVQPDDKTLAKIGKVVGMIFASLLVAPLTLFIGSAIRVWNKVAGPCQTTVDDAAKKAGLQSAGPTASDPQPVEGSSASDTRVVEELDEEADEELESPRSRSGSINVDLSKLSDAEHIAPSTPVGSATSSRSTEQSEEEREDSDDNSTNGAATVVFSPKGNQPLVLDTPRQSSPRKQEIENIASSGKGRKRERKEGKENKSSDSVHVPGRKKHAASNSKAR